VHVRVSGSTRLVDPSGRDLQAVEIPDSVVLPQSERQLLVRLPHPGAHQAFRVVSLVDAGMPELLEAETVVALAPIP
jgi:hypothetical protein